MTIFDKYDVFCYNYIMNERSFRPSNHDRDQQPQTPPDADLLRQMSQAGFNMVVDQPHIPPALRAKMEQRRAKIPDTAYESLAKRLQDQGVDLSHVAHLLPEEK